VVHCAAAIPSRSNAFDRDNTGATVALTSLLETADVLKRVVHVSSMAVYKPPRSGRWIISEDAETVDVSDSGADRYARSKRASELTFDFLADKRPEVKVTHLRASSIYGRGMVLTTVLPAFVARALRDESLHLYGARGYMQNFIHVRDVAELEMAIIFNDAAPRVVNAFSDDTYGLLALADLVKTGVGSHSQIVDASDNTIVPEAIFMNTQAKQLHPRFRRLADHVLDAA